MFNCDKIPFLPSFPFKIQTKEKTDFYANFFVVCAFLGKRTQAALKIERKKKLAQNLNFE